MTVHIANDAGMQNVVKTIKNVGIGDYEPYPAFALGAGDTTVVQMVNAYSALVNQGRLHQASTIDYVQDRTGKVIWRADTRDCRSCNMAQWNGAPMPRFGMRGKQVMDPRTAYQVVHMLEGVVERGTATVLRDLKLPLFGKTGTTNGPTNAWFVGGSADIIAGVYLGFDQPRPMGGWVQGGRVAAPIFKQFVQETRDHWSDEPVIARQVCAWSASTGGVAGVSMTRGQPTTPRLRSSGKHSSPTVSRRSPLARTRSLHGARRSSTCCAGPGKASSCAGTATAACTRHKPNGRLRPGEAASTNGFRRSAAAARLRCAAAMR
jgi:membrane carboxypeptidase/penicillin-binding protein